MTITIAASTNAPIPLDVSDRIYVGRDVSVTVANGLGIGSSSSSANGIEVFIDGTVVSGASNAVLLQDDDVDFIGANRLMIGETGVVRSMNITGNSAIYMLGSESYLDNAGEVSGNWGAYLQRWDAGTVANSGRIAGVGDAALYLSASDGVRVINSGELVAGVDAVEAVNSSIERLFNTGEILGGTGAGVRLSSGSGASVIVNRGLIAGGEAALIGSEEIETVRNRGVMDGDVLLGAGDDVYDGGRASVIEGRIAGEDGADLLKGGGGDELIFGGAGDDEIRGGRGDDEMRGDDGADLFVVAWRGGDDVIRDLTHGADRLDLSAFDLSWKQLKGAMHDADAGVLIDLESRHGGTVLLKGAEIADYTKGDFIL